ncbi:alpha/beta hydrolase [Algoriphagus resistens]|uniref:alpha/beta hydrolase n=1 Tax=Algoriphagus resistens TaxID=1750590 RepID=UPI000716B4B3|nr:alpha/beta hydrolase [Algoriphagus resistens]
MQLLFIQGGGEGSYDWDKPLVNAIKEKLKPDDRLHYPKMPEEENPDYQLWKTAILNEISLLNEPMVFIGHSLGGSVLLKLLYEEKIHKHCKSLFLVSSPFWGEPDWHSDAYMLDSNFADKLPTVKKFIYHAEDDQFVPFSHHNRYREHLPDAMVRTFKEAGHEMLEAVDTMIADLDKLRVEG